MRRPPLLALGLLVLIVAARGDPKDNVLNNACAMLGHFNSTCENHQLERRDDTATNYSRPSMLTPCTCTNVYFNLWSACIWVQKEENITNISLPSCSDLIQDCKQASVTVTTNFPVSDKQYPSWAQVGFPTSNNTFDVTAAIESASESHKWTLVQVLVPILVGLAVAVLLLSCFFIWRRRRRANRARPWMQTAGNRPRFQFPTISSIARVRELNRSSSWSIEEREEPLDEYQFVSYPNSLQGSRASGHVRLSSSSSGTNLQGHPPMLQIPGGNRATVRTWPGKSIWKVPLQRARLLQQTLPLPWRSAKRVVVKNVPSYQKFRVDAPDSDSPLSAQARSGSLLGHGATGRGRSNLHHETIFEREDDDSDSDTEGLPLIPQDHSRLDLNAPLPSLPVEDVALASRPPPAVGMRSPGQPSPAQQSPRHAPPTKSPPRIPLPIPPPPTSQRPPAAPLPPPLTSPPAPRSRSSTATRASRTVPPAPTSPPPVPPAPRPSPRAPRNAPLPPQPSSGTLPPLPSPPGPPLSAPLLLSPPVPPALTARPVSIASGSDIFSISSSRRATSDSSSVRSIPRAPTPPYGYAEYPSVVPPAPELSHFSIPTSASSSRRATSDTSSVRSLPRAQTPPYGYAAYPSAAPAPAPSLSPTTNAILRAIANTNEPESTISTSTSTPPHSAPPYVRRSSMDLAHSPPPGPYMPPPRPDPIAPARTVPVRRLPLPPS